MTNLIINVDEEVLERARIRAMEENSSINAVLRRYLEEYARGDDLRCHRRAAVDALLALAAEARTGSGGKGWTRDELHEG